MPSTKKWSDMTPNEIVQLKRQQCSKCYYFSRSAGGQICTGICDYLSIVGRSRRCSPLDCKEKGIYKPIPRSRKGKAIRTAHG